MNWLVLSLITLILWGIISLLTKIATRFIDWKQYLVISAIGVIIPVFFLYFYFKPELNFHQPGFYYAFLVGVVGVMSTITFYLALSLGKASIVVTLTALYPLVTILLAFLILQEKVSIFQAFGIVLAIVSIFLMSL